MKFVRFVCLFFLFAITTVLAQTNPVPFANQPLVPTAVSPGGPGFTLTVNGTGFVSTSTIDWNGTPLTTTFVSSSQLTATVPASNIATASTASITVSSPSPGGGTSNVVFFPVSAPTTLQFTEVPDAAFDIVGPPVVADFNRDGKLDFAGTECPGSFGNCLFDMFLGNGDGTFKFMREPFSFLEFAVGDFNNDGILDLVGTSCSTQFCSSVVALGKGDGTFPNGITINNTPLFISQPLTGDFNGDGKLDVMIEGGDLGGPNSIYVYLGNGDGTFGSPVVSAPNTPYGLSVIGDFNGDGKLDLIGVESSQLAWFQGNGDGTFQAPSTSYTLGPDTGIVLAADLNGDGKLDLLTVQGSPTNTFTVLLGNGDGTFNLESPYRIGTALNGAALGDMNADGKLDLILSDPGSKQSYILPGNGDGTFQSPRQLPFLSTFSAVGDFNNDGKLDLALAPTSLLLQEASQPSLSPSSLTFGDQAVNTTSPAQKVTLTNNGTGPLTISSIGITGADPTDFSQTNNCPASLAAGASCQISVTFTPTALGARSASLAVTDNAPGSPQSIPLSGTGAQPVVQFNPTSVTFNPQTVGGTTSPQVVTLTNEGGSTLTIASIGITGSDASDFADTSACGSTVAAGASCQIKVTFTPTASGNRSAALSVSDNAPGSPQTVALSGTGQDFALSTSGPASATVSPGQTATYTVVVTPSGGFNQTVDLTCSGAPAQSMCTVSSSVTLDGVNPSTVTVSVVTNARAIGMTQRVHIPPISGAFGLWLGLCGILGFCMLAVPRRGGGGRRLQRVRGLVLICVLATGLAMPACGGGGGSSGGGTQAGTYTLTVTGTSSATKLTHKTSLTLVVQ
jgi:hypothetical protein